MLFDFELALLLLVVGFNLTLGIFVYFSNPKSHTNLIFNVLVIVTSIWLGINYLTLFSVVPEEILLLSRLSIFFAVPQIFSVYLFAHTLPHKKVPIGKGKLTILFLVSFVVMLLTVSPYSFTSVDLQTLSPTPGVGLIIFSFYALIFTISAFYKFFQRIKNSYGMEKSQLQYVLTGILIMFGLIIATILIPVSIFQTTVFVPFSPLYVSMFLGITTYAIVRHRLLDVRVLVARTISYALIILIVVAGYILILFGVATSIPGVELTANLVTTLSVISIILFFTAKPLQRGVEVLTDRVFFKAGYNTEELLSSITKQMASNIELDVLSEKILSLLISEVKVSKGAFVLLHDHKIGNIESIGYHNSKLKNVDWVNKIAHSDKSLFVYEDLEDEALKNEFRETDVSIAMPLRVNSREIGIFIAGPKSSGEVYSSQDLELFEILAPQLAVALQNAESYVEIQEFSRTLERKVEARTKELRAAQEGELDRARELIKLKDEFVFIASHDLKTPVTAINGYISMINENPDIVPEELKDKLKSIDDASKRLTQLIDDLLEVARSESGTIKIQVEPVDSEDIINSVIDEVKNSAQSRGISIEKEVSPNSAVLADRKKLQEVIENLLSNAIKYNKENGSVNISVYPDESRENIIFEVVDTGLGIPQDVQDKIFTKFFRAKQEGTEDVTGTGLGLFVVRMLVEKMKGRIVFESKEGKGTMFMFKLPAA